jgi:regulator of protease activity HflC (stomatin/prohibitin superfamily)
VLTRLVISQRPALAVIGWLGVLVLAGCAWWIVADQQNADRWLWVPAVVGVLTITSLVIVTPGQTSVIQFFGSYIGTVQRPGFWWVLPLTRRRQVSVRVRNFETGHLKVNDADGSPVEIAAIVVWQIADTAKSTYAVENYLDFVTVQAESALRHVATTHPYDDSTDTGTSLRGSTDIVATELAPEVATRVSIAGVEIVEVRISHLAYAPEIAQAMLPPSPVVNAGSLYT